MSRLVSKQYQIQYLLAFLGLTMSVLANAQNADSLNQTFSLSAQYRPRFEVRSGTFRPLTNSEKSAALTSNRLRLVFDYQYKDFMTMRVSPQAVSIWGQENMVQGITPGSSLAFFETWVKLKMASSTSLQIGRQVISLDDERFFGELDWAQGGRVHDAVSVHYNKSKLSLKGYFAYNQNYKALYANNLSNPSGNMYNTTDAMPYKWMQTGWGSYTINKNSKITALISNLGLQNATSDTATNAKVNFLQTFGLNYYYSDDKNKLQIAAYYQGGKNLAGVITNAYAGTINASRALTKQWNIGLGFDMVSGNDVGVAQSENTAFNPYFHTGHKFYGYMDYYYAGNAHKNAGLYDGYLKLNYKTPSGLSASLDFHQFFAPKRITNGMKDFDKNLGQEVDITCSYKINSFTSLIGGYSLYFTTPTIDFLKNISDSRPVQQWFWLSLNVNPKLLMYKSKANF